MTWKAFVVSQIVIERSLPLSFGGMYQVSAATDNEIYQIKSRIDEFISLYPRCPPEDVYERACVVDGNGVVDISQMRELARTEWRYYMISAPTKLSLIALNSASALTDVDLRLNALQFSGGSTHWLPEILIPFYTMRHPVPAERLSEMYFVNLGDIANRIFNEVGVVEDEIKNLAIFRAIEIYHSLLSLRDRHTLFILGLFSIIELLVAHEPGENLSSISHQIRTKFPLLAARFKNPIDYTKYFGTVPATTIWNKLYELRSKVVHGGVIDFEKKLGVLKSERIAQIFLDSAVRSLILHAMTEPKLVADLKLC